MLRFLTAGESHGPELVATVEGVPAGFDIDLAAINADLARRQWLALLDVCTIDDAVTIDEHGAAADRLYHLVGARCSLGCDTRQCQTTAWNASECGVMSFSSTVGITTIGSPTRAA